MAAGSVALFTSCINLLDSLPESLSVIVVGESVYAKVGSDINIVRAKSVWQHWIKYLIVYVTFSRKSFFIVIHCGILAENHSTALRVTLVTRN